MRSWSTSPERQKYFRVTAYVLPLALLLGACSGNEDPPPPAAPPSTDWQPPGNEQDASSTPECSVPREGCACETEGEAVECGRVQEVHDDYVTCSIGTRTCDAGKWGQCLGERITLRSREESHVEGAEISALGSSVVCPTGFDPCDPYCNSATDTPGGITAPAGFSATPSGLTLVATFIPQCTSLTITPSSSTLTLTGSSLTSFGATPVTFTLAAAPSGCVGSSFPATYTIDRFDRASITGSTSSNGSLTMALPIAGTIKVTAYGAGLSASTNIAVKVNIAEAPTSDGAATPNQSASAAQRTAFGSAAAPAAGSGASTATWLYPYPNTYLPLALPAPVAQYRYANGGGDSTSEASAVKLSLRYPVGATATGATFNYSLVVEESNALICAEDAADCNFLDPQVVIPETAWDLFEQTARGGTAELIVQRLRRRSSGNDVLELEQRLPIRFVDGQLKGTVYYNSYTSPQGGNTGAILSIAPGATSPTLAVQPNGTCSTCHSINLSGTRLITNGATVNGSYDFDTSKSYNMTTSGPSPSVVATYTSNRFTFGGPWKDGSLYMSHGGAADPSWHSQTAPSALYKVTADNTPIYPTNWPITTQAVTPRFSPDGTKLAFGFWSAATNLPQSPSGSIAAVSGGTRLVAVDFSCASPPCTGSSTGWSVSNARDLTPGVTDRVAWPSFAPNGNSVIYQRQYRSSKATLSWTPSDIGTIAGALAELWISNVPANKNTAATPTRLLALNGLNSGGTSYLPQQARTVVNNAFPLYTYQPVRHELSQSGGGGTPPAIFLTGRPTFSPADFRIDIVTGGTRGLATFRYSTDGGVNWSATSTTNTTVSLGSTGLTANFASGTYSGSSIYKTQAGRVVVTGTPTGGPWDFRLQIVGTGNRGSATFRYSTDGGSSWSSTLTTAATVALGSTGLVANFASVNYESSSWIYGYLVSHYHQDNATFQLSQADGCSNNAALSGVYDYRTNYLPSFAPTEAGGMSWVVFTSRRMYGNVAYENGWDAEPGYGCYSGKVPAKKLWIAAVDSTWTPGSDPSHPAFYLPGQELAAGNSDGYWVNQACGVVGDDCQSDDDCCNGTGSNPTTQCRVLDTSTFPPIRQCENRSTCAYAGSSCTTTADCCSGLTCPSGGGLCVSQPAPLFEPQTYTRLYEATCPAGTKPVWRFFEWQATIPSSTKIEFFVQGRGNTSDAYAPSTPLLAGTATTSSPGTSWVRGPTTVDALLKTQGLSSQKYLLVTMTFTPDAAGTLAPTLTSWRQVYDCVFAE
jgi:hypothetical protein